MKCEYGCGEDAIYKTKKGKMTCNKVASKCSAINPKGRKKNNRRGPVSIDYFQICEYGCGEEAKFKFSNGSYSCRNQAGNCPAKRSAAARKSSMTKTIMTENGKTIAENAAIKIAENKKNNIDNEGLNAHQRNGKRVAEIKRMKINEDGLNVHQVSGIKYKQWLDTDEGKEWVSFISKTNRERMVATYDTGITEAKRRAMKMVETKLSNIDENGLNSFDRAHYKNKNSGYIDGVFYQSSNERRFLERAKCLGIIDSIKRGTAIKYYFAGNEKIYLPDYQIDNKVFEIKSKYTMFGSKGEYLEQNIAKLDSASKLGYEVYVVIDDETLLYEDFRKSLRF